MPKQINTNLFKYYSGIIGIGLFIITIVVGGFTYNGYNHFSQLISEMYAKNTKFGIYLRLFGFFPSGLLIAWFTHFVCKRVKIIYNPNSLISIGILGMGVFYGLFTALSSVFVCNIDCKGTGISQSIHNILGAITYLLTPICIFLIAIGLRKNKNIKRYSIFFWFTSLSSMVSVIIFLNFHNRQFEGIIQRITEAFFLITILMLYKIAKPYQLKT